MPEEGKEEERGQEPQRFLERTVMKPASNDVLLNNKNSTGKFEDQIGFVNPFMN